MRLILSAFLITLLLAPAAARAEGRLVSAGKPSLHNISEVSSQNMIDLYQRQILYREERLDFRRRLEARQQSFANPRREAIGQYNMTMQQINGYGGNYQMNMP